MQYNGKMKKGQKDKQWSKKKQQHGIKRTIMRTPVKIGVEPMCSTKVSDPALCMALPVLLV